ncbi:MAG: hypothetical protein EBX52_05540 [Proteobacteria bacterium]|nr:hypothetical protein [Pseudomonadota bacterium]
MILKQYWAYSGYDAEEHYFAKINRELINRIKAEQGKRPQSHGSVKSGGKVIPFPTMEARSSKKRAA